MADYSQYPKSVAELRADRSEKASDWSPRDAIIAFLRRIDSGEINPDVVIICGREKGKDGTRPVFNVSSPDGHVSIGLLIDVSRSLIDKV